ncbi:MAG: GNAT family N-acetyltransferase [Oleiphilaceae bacterium]|nr:GNAT family N-acetyltransferase [Oleiphilaceae bacterium]
MNVRPYQTEDWPATWRMIEPVFRAGETYPYSPEIPESEAHKVWIEMPAQTFVAVDEYKGILGTYYIKPNQPALGAHVCNCGYIVAENARGAGIASLMCEHSQTVAVDLGFQAMQYNLVVSTNTGAVSIWKRLGFETAGTLPRAFRHPRLGLVDAFVMFKQLSQ